MTDPAVFNGNAALVTGGSGGGECASCPEVAAVVDTVRSRAAGSTS